MGHSYRMWSLGQDGVRINCVLGILKVMVPLCISLRYETKTSPKSTEGPKHFEESSRFPLPDSSVRLTRTWRYSELTSWRAVLWSSSRDLLESILPRLSFSLNKRNKKKIIRWYGLGSGVLVWRTEATDDTERRKSECTYFLLFNNIHVKDIKSCSC